MPVRQSNNVLTKGSRCLFFFVIIFKPQQLTQRCKSLFFLLVKSMKVLKDDLEEVINFFASISLIYSQNTSSLGLERS